MNESNVLQLKNWLEQSLGEVVELVQTHISWVLLSKEFAFKIKKPVNFGFVDFSTVEKRHLFCEKEVELNKKLSPELYLGVVPVTKSRKIQFGGTGELVDFAVKMKRLNSEKRMDLLLVQNKVSKKNIVDLSGIIFDFHKKTNVIMDENFSSPEKIIEAIKDFESVEDIVRKELSQEDKIQKVIKKCTIFIEKNKSLFVKRQKKGFIKACHGDLHSKNIFIDSKIFVFDCIEFNEDFRFIDVVSEIAFMAMDLDANNEQMLSRLFVEEYQKLSEDKDLLKLLNLYKSYRANVRAKVSALSINDSLSEEEKEVLVDDMETYLRLADEYAELL